VEIKRKKKAKDIHNTLAAKDHKRSRSEGGSSNEPMNIQTLYPRIEISRAIFSITEYILLSGQLDIFKSMIIEEVLPASLNTRHVCSST
jgi:hypothetical protein